MGLISIKTAGSFGLSERVFSAQQHGHAHAVNEAQKYLCDIMKGSIAQDHDCHDEGVKPENGFTVK